MAEKLSRENIHLSRTLTDECVLLVDDLKMPLAGILMICCSFVPVTRNNGS